VTDKAVMPQQLQQLRPVAGTVALQAVQVAVLPTC
jgi:hypothetical protein